MTLKETNELITISNAVGGINELKRLNKMIWEQYSYGDPNMRIFTSEEAHNISRWIDVRIEELKEIYKDNKGENNDSKSL